MNKVTVRWHDGYLEEFDAEEVRFGSDLLWMRLSDGKNRHIPLRSVRWFGMSKESHQSGEDDGDSAWTRASAEWSPLSTVEGDATITKFRCSKCGMTSKEAFLYCPKCGAYMMNYSNGRIGRCQ